MVKQKRNRYFGIASEGLHSGRGKSLVFKGNQSWLKVIVILAMAWLLSRAFFLQVVTGEKNKQLAEGNRIEVKKITPERGIIRDRFGVVLARNGLDKEGKVVREYPMGEATAHLVGYIGEVTKEEIETCIGCRGAGEVVGKIGSEKMFEERLHGRASEELVEVGASGENLRVISKREGRSGETIEISVDGELQKTIARILAEYEQEKGMVHGAVIVSKVATGEILGLVSWPSFDANLFTGSSALPGRYKDVQEILSDEDNKPAFNRVFGGAFPPGSVFKLVTAVAGLEEGKIDESTRIADTGELKVGPYRYGSWYFDQYGGTEGEMDLTKGLARSNDIFFYKVGEWVGINKLSLWSKKFGLGAKTGLNWPGEVNGMVPDPLEKERRTGEKWFLGNTYHMAIGQGDILSSPAQINRMSGATITGKLCDFKLLVEGESKCSDLGISQKTRQMVVNGMIAACSSGGTAFPFFGFAPQVACKTGTAQHGGEETKPHAWISVVVPRIKEDGNYDLGSYEQGVVITVLLEAAGEGSYEAGPVAEKIARFIVERKY